MRKHTRHFLVAIWFLLLTLIFPAELWSKPVRKLSRKSLTVSVVRGALSGRKVLHLVKGDPQAMAGLIKLAKLVAKAGQTDKDAIRNVGEALKVLEAQLGPQEARQFLRNYSELVDWARAAPAARRLEELQDISRSLTRKGNQAPGAWYELMGAHRNLTNPPPRLERLQPKPPGDKELFRDAVVRNADDSQSYLEAKNWICKGLKNGRSELRKQVRSHFDRLAKAGEDFSPVPPAKSLLYNFNLPPPPDGAAKIISWRKAIRNEVFKKDNPRIQRPRLERDSS